MIEEVLFDEEVDSHFVHMETHMDFESIHRHVTVFALTASRLILVHVDDEPAGPGETMRGIASVEDISLNRMRNVLISRVYENPEDYSPDSRPVEITITLGWDSVKRVEVFPETCGDPHCDGDHGYGGNLVPEDVSLRVSAQAEGQQAVERAVAFALNLKHKVYFARQGAR